MPPVKVLQNCNDYVTIVDNKSSHTNAKQIQRQTITHFIKKAVVLRTILTKQDKLPQKSRFTLT